MPPIKKTTWRVLLACAVASASIDAPAAEPISKEQVDALVRPLIAGQWVQALTVGLIDGRSANESGDGITELFAGYGQERDDTQSGEQASNASGANRPNEDTLFEIGSITKAFTGVLLADCVEQGLVALDDPVDKYLRDGAVVPSRDGRKITLVDLATHRSGLPRLPANLVPADPLNPYSAYTVDQLYEFLPTYKLPRTPGERSDYSNLGMGLLGHALARCADCDYEQLVRERICNPLGMTSTMITLDAPAQARLAPGHTADGQPQPNWDLPALAGAGALRSSTRDMLAFLRANLMLINTPLDKALAASHERQGAADGPGGDGIGLGWALRGPKGIIWHNGQTGGYCSFLAFEVERKVGVVVLANTASSTVDGLGWQLLALLRGESPEPLPLAAAISVEASALNRYVGRYELVKGVIFTVTREESRLYAQLTGQPAIRIYPRTETEFFYKAVDAQISFLSDPDAKVDRLVLHQNGRDTEARRLNDQH